jgi:hemerythrin-like domain-containing protein
LLFLDRVSVHAQKRLPREPGPLRRLLEGDHLRFDAMLDRVLSAAADEKWDDARQLYAQFQRALLEHIAAEEELLFPAFERYCDGGHLPLLVLREEHREIAGLLDEIARALGGPGPDVGLFRELAELLAAHGQMEDQVLHPACDERLPREVHDRLSEQVAARLRGRDR